MADYCMCMLDISGQKRRKAVGNSLSLPGTCFQSSLDLLRALPEVILNGTGIFLGRKMGSGGLCRGGFPRTVDN